MHGVDIVELLRRLVCQITISFHTFLCMTNHVILDQAISSQATQFTRVSRQGLVCLLLQFSGMPRRGWISIDVPDGWLQVLRWKTLPALKWSKAERKSAIPQPLAQCGSLRVPMDPDTFIAEARARVGKLEVAINALGENDPAVNFLKEVLHVAQAQCQVRFVD